MEYDKIIGSNYFYTICLLFALLVHFCVKICAFVKNENFHALNKGLASEVWWYVKKIFPLIWSGMSQEKNEISYEENEKFKQV